MKKNDPCIFGINITNNKNLNLLLSLLISCMSAKSAPHILPTKRECTFLLLNFQIIGLFSSSANSLLEIFSFLIVHQKFFCQKIYKPLKQDHVDVNHIWDFWQY